MTTKNPRREAFRVLRAIHSNATDMKRTWDGPRHALNPDTGRYEVAPDEQQPENRAEEWLRLHQYMEAIVQQATDLRNFAADMVRQLGED